MLITLLATVLVVGELGFEGELTITIFIHFSWSFLCPVRCSGGYVDLISSGGEMTFPGLGLGLFMTPWR